MILSHRKKFIFISIPKNATTAIRYGLRRWADVKSIGDRESYFYHHVNGAKMEEYFNQEGLAWNEYYKFAFVRNPFSRIVSQYFYALKCADNQKIKLFSPDYYKNCLKVKAPDDYKHACREIGIKYQPLLIQNTSKHKHYTEYYDDETIDFAHNKFKASIERFNYKFGE